jgi:5-carboxymethyl-2-hydroxymuconate isomerase
MSHLLDMVCSSHTFRVSAAHRGRLLDHWVVYDAAQNHKQIGPDYKTEKEARDAAQRQNARAATLALIDNMLAQLRARPDGWQDTIAYLEARRAEVKEAA